MENVVVQKGKYLRMGLASHAQPSWTTVMNAAALPFARSVLVILLLWYYHNNMGREKCVNALTPSTKKVTNVNHVQARCPIVPSVTRQTSARSACPHSWTREALASVTTVILQWTTNALRANRWLQIASPARAAPLVTSVFRITSLPMTVKDVALSTARRVSTKRTGAVSTRCPIASRQDSRRSRPISPCMTRAGRSAVT